jgi:signal transduction histidine kinase
VLIALFCVLLSLTPAAPTDASGSEPLNLAWAILGPVVMVAGCLTLLWRRRLPMLVFLVAFTLQALNIAGALPGSTLLILFASYALAVYGSTQLAWIAFGIGTGGLAVLGALLTITGVTTLGDGANPVINAAVLGLIGTLIGVNVGERKRYLAAVIDRSRQLLVERDQQVQLAAAGERARIAREMHDIVSHSLTVIVALSEGAAATPDRDQARAASAATAETARSALTEMRSMLGVPREEGDPLPLAPLIAPPPRDTVATAQRAGYPVTLATAGTPAALPAAVEHAVSRIVQEGVTNAMRHAPLATSISVRLTYSPAEVLIEITNDGAKPAVGEPGFGLRGLTERTAHVRGTIEYGPFDGGRWMLRAALPTAPDSQEGQS